MTGMTPAVPLKRSKRFHTNPINVWTGCRNTPLLHHDRDGRLPEPGEGDKPFGQDGWHVAFEFADFKDLANKLGNGAFDLPPFVCKNWILDCGPIEEFQVGRLAISAHGAPGAMDVDGVFSSASDPEGQKNPAHKDSRLLNVKTLKSGKYQKEIDLIKRCLHRNSKVFLMGCRIGHSKVGMEFLKALSKKWPMATLIAITTIGFSHGARQQKPDDIASAFPGMRDTKYMNHKKPGFPARDYEKLKIWNDLKRLPWVQYSPPSPHTVIVQDGLILRPTASEREKKKKKQ